MRPASSLPDRPRVAQHIKCLRAIVRGEHSPLGREWNNTMSKRERQFWARAAGLGWTDSRRVAYLEWSEVDSPAQIAIRAALIRAADRAGRLLDGGEPNA